MDFFFEYLNFFINQQIEKADNFTVIALIVPNY